MTKKTVKDLDAEIVILKNENSDLKKNMKLYVRSMNTLRRKLMNVSQ